MEKKILYKRPIEILYYYDGRSTISSRKADYKAHALTPHGAKRAAYKHLDPDYGDARRAIITDLRSGLELWNMHTTKSGDIITATISAQTQQVIKKDIKQMLKLGRKF